MLVCLTLIWSIFLTSITCTAQIGPKLALAAIEAAPTLSKHINDPANGATNSTEQFAEFSRAIATHLVDDFHSRRMFDIMAGIELEKVIVQKEGQYDLRDPKTARAIKLADIRYILTTVLEDYQDKTITQAQGRLAYQSSKSAAQSSYRGNSTVRRYGLSTERSIAMDRASAAASFNSQGQFDPHASRRQAVSITVRSKLYDALSGRLLDTATHRYSTNRSYLALASEGEMESSRSIIEDAAIDISSRIVSQTANAAFPIKVLEKVENELTINRGIGDHIKVGQVYNVFNIGKEIRDPTTGDILGEDEVLVGRTYVTSLRDKFSKTTILENNGIIPGSILRISK